MKGMVRGQARDLGEPAPATLAELEQLHEEKTAALFRAALEIGAAAAGADEPTTRALARYGECYGVAFQHADDLDDADHPGHAAEARQRVAALVAEGVSAARERLGPRAELLESFARELPQRSARRRSLRFGRAPERLCYDGGSMPLDENTRMGIPPVVAPEGGKRDRAYLVVLAGRQRGRDV